MPAGAHMVGTSRRQARGQMLGHASTVEGKVERELGARDKGHTA